MDKLEEQLSFTVTKGDKTFTFRRPTAKQLLSADVLAAKLRENIPVASLSYGIVISDMIASLNTYISEPQKFDFGDLYNEEINEIYNEVANWLGTFHKSVSNAK